MSRKLDVAFYKPTPAFGLIIEHVCVSDENMMPVAVCGPSDDPASHADARVFSVAFDLLAACKDAVENCETCRGEGVTARRCARCQTFERLITRAEQTTEE